MKPILVHRDRSGKFVSRHPAGGRRARRMRALRRNPAGDPASIEADALLSALAAEDSKAQKEAAAKTKRQAAAQKAAATRAAKAAAKAAKVAEEAAQKVAEADAVKKAASVETDSALQEIYKAEAKKLQAEARKAQAEARKAQAEAKKAETAQGTRSRSRRVPQAELASRARSLSKRAKSLKDAGLRSVYRQRASALRLRERARKGKLSKRAQESMRAHGLTRVNPGFKGMFGDLKVLVPRILAVGASAWAVSKVGEMAHERFFKESESPTIQKYGNALAVGGTTILAYLAARMVAPKYASAVLMGGTAATVVHALVAVKMGEPPRSAGNYLFPNALQGYVALKGTPSVEDFASPAAMEVLDKDLGGSLSGSVFD